MCLWTRQSTVCCSQLPDVYFKGNQQSENINITKQCSVINELLAQGIGMLHHTSGNQACIYVYILPTTFIGVGA